MGEPYNYETALKFEKEREADWKEHYSKPEKRRMSFYAVVKKYGGEAPVCPRCGEEQK